MATPKGGNFGKVLEIDLSKQTYKTRPVSDEILQQYIGGRGLGAYYAVTEYKAGKNALDEDAFVFVGPGPLSGTMAVSHRTCFAHKSPYTGLMTHARVAAPTWPARSSSPAGTASTSRAARRSPSGSPS